jgi:chromosome segregation ATPase
LRPIPDSVRIEVLRLWLDGMTYRQISARAGLSIGVISKIIEEYRQRTPDIEELRRLHLALRDVQASLPDALRGARFLRNLDEREFDSKYLPQCLDFIKEAGERTSELASAGGRLIELDKKAGKPYEQFLLEFGEKLKAEGELSGRVKALEDKELKLVTSIRHLEKLRALQETIDRNKITATILESLIGDGLRLHRLGFTTQQAEILVGELAKRGLDPATASAQIARLLQECSNLEEAKKKAEAEANKCASELETAKNNIISLQREIQRSEDELRKLEENYKNRKGLLEKEYEAHESKLKAEHDAEKQAVETAFHRRKQETESQIHDLQNQASTLKTEIQDLELLKANISEAEAALQRIKDGVGRSRILGPIVSLIENPTAPKSRSEVLEAMHAISQGFKTYLETTSFIGWRKKIDLTAALDRLSEGLVEELR